MKKAVFFDLDGTLLPMDNEAFIGTYFLQIQKSGVLQALHQEKGMKMFGAAVEYMMGEHGHASNSEAFCSQLEDLSGVNRDVFLPLFEQFYHTHYKEVKKIVRNVPEIHETLRVLKQKNYTLVLATSPVFPKLATEMRVGWAGLDIADFAHVTYYENCRYTKPNLKYYEELLRETGFIASECYMVGNSVTEDICAARLGFETFLVTDYHIGNPEEIHEGCLKGTYGELLQWVKALPAVEKEVS